MLPLLPLILGIGALLTLTDCPKKCEPKPCDKDAGPCPPARDNIIDDRLGMGELKRLEDGYNKGPRK